LSPAARPCGAKDRQTTEAAANKRAGDALRSAMGNGVGSRTHMQDARRAKIVLSPAVPAHTMGP
jgi:uncharacterized protein YfiM (DUF2279 family)